MIVIENSVYVQKFFFVFSRINNELSFDLVIIVKGSIDKAMYFRGKTDQQNHISESLVQVN